MSCGGDSADCRIALMRTPVLLLLSSLAMSTQSPTNAIFTVGTPPIYPYSQAVKAGGLIYIAGATSQDASGSTAPKGDVKGQTKAVIERMRALLTAAGSSLDQVVAVTVYLKSAGDFAAMNEVYSGFWAKDPPTRTTVVADFVVPDALVEISMIAVPTGAERIVIHPASWIKSPSPYSYAIRTGDTLFLSGLVSRNGRDNLVVPGDINAQTAVVLDNATELLKAAGMTLENVVSSRVYLPDVASFQPMNAIYRKYFTSAPPARATVVAGLAGSQYVVEITLVASSSQKRVIDDGRPANPNLSAAIRAGDRVYVAGMLGNTAETRGDIGAQMRETLARIRRALGAAGCSPADVNDAVVYLTDAKNFGAMNDVYRAFFERDFPARATVQTGLVAADGLVEIMFTARCPGK
jgi:2-iminobutanoate/2-iminopropanoate deaminase